MSTKMIEISDSFSPSSNFTIDESADQSVVDGKYILARARGKFFEVNGNSLNKRFYSRRLWEKVINETAEDRSNGKMLGTIGHDQPLDDAALLDGKASHKVTKLWITENGEGHGEILVLGTPSGQILNTYLRAGVQFPVSSRGFGQFNGKTDKGVPIIDENTFVLKTFDFVVSNGVPGAIPSLVESLQLLNSSDVKEQGNMDMKILESMSEEKVKLQTTLNEALDTVEHLKSELAVRNARITDLEENLKEYKVLGTVNTLSTQISETKDHKVLQKMVEDYQSLGTVDEVKELVKFVEGTAKQIEELGSFDQIAEALDKSSEIISEYSELGTIEDISRAFDLMESHLEKVSDLGSPEDLSNILDITEKYADLGSVEELDEALDILEKFIELGSPEDISKVFDITESYLDLGTPQEISDVFSVSESIVNNFNKKKHIEEVKSFSESLKIDETLANDLLSKMSKEEAITVVNNIRGRKSDKISERYSVATKEFNESVQPSEKAKSILNESRSSRLMNNFSK